MKLVSSLLCVALAIVFSTSCASFKKAGSSSFDDSPSPYVKEEVKPTVKPQPKEIVVKEEKVKVIDSMPEKEVFKYYVIIGSFRVLDNAKNYKQQLLEDGFTPVLLENENGLFRVSVAAYNSETSARTKIGDIRTKFEKHADTWLLIRKQ